MNLLDTISSHSRSCASGYWKTSGYKYFIGAHILWGVSMLVPKTAYKKKVQKYLYMEPFKLHRAEGDEAWVHY